MSEFLHGTALSEAIREILGQRPLCCAVAYWGPRALDYFGAGADLTRVRIVCDLGANGTDPDAIAALMAAGAEVRDRPELHAKVYFWADEAIVASANASARGLEVRGLGTRIEAGVRLTECAKVTAWFEQVFDDSRRVGPEMIANEKARRSLLPTAAPAAGLLPFDQYQPPPDFPECPMFCWYDEDVDDENEVEKSAVNEHWGGVNEGLIEKVREQGIPLNDFEGNRCLIGGSVLWAVKRRRKIVDDRFFFSHYSWKDGVVKDVLRTTRGVTDVVIFAEDRSRDPWNTADKEFQEAVRTTLQQPEFKLLVSGKYSSPWGTVERQALVKKLWPAVREEYLRLRPTA